MLIFDYFQPPKVGNFIWHILTDCPSLTQDKTLLCKNVRSYHKTQGEFSYFLSRGESEMPLYPTVEKCRGQVLSCPQEGLDLRSVPPLCFASSIESHVLGLEAGPQVSSRSRSGQSKKTGGTISPKP